MLNLILDVIEGFTRGWTDSNFEKLKTFAVMLAAALIIGAPLTQAFEFAQSVVGLIAAIGSLALAIGILTIVGWASDAFKGPFRY
ncbi:hypothetical protein [Methanococcoides methylutens]|uniref:Uncharacterized protein n=1 Tax=Methanococcoides methylutens MM1 TaxID=1434104 RepID=A0A0E3SSF1_METMT|nr:hypothetical protein [Methanococcoides methylutens]AKB86111.1 hypothetical protein MCMEM_2058 [Methanococcoides methylutens MM1]